MNYYTLELACDTPETGSAYPQIQKLKSGYDNNKHNSIYSYLKKSIHSFSDEIPDLDSFILHNRAKPTDFISNAITSSGFFISKKVKCIFDKYNLIQHRFYPMKLIHKKNNLKDYFWCHCISNYTDFVNYEKTSFYVYKRFVCDYEPVTISSLSDLIEKKKELALNNPNTYVSVRAKVIVLKPDFFDMNLDLFKIGSFDSDFYISESLKDDLIQNNVTGYKVEPTHKIQ